MIDLLKTKLLVMLHSIINNLVVVVVGFFFFFFFFDFDFCSVSVFCLLACLYFYVEVS